MASVDEGIGGRKWSFERSKDGVLVLMEGKTPLAALTPEGEKLQLLLVTAPQLWSDGNEAVKVTRYQLEAITNDASMTKAQAAIVRLGNSIAKAVGKGNWLKVSQA